MATLKNPSRRRSPRRSSPRRCRASWPSRPPTKQALRGRLRQARAGQGRLHDARYRRLDRVHDQGHHGHGGHAAGGARQARSRAARRARWSPTWRGPGARGLRRGGQAPAAGAQAADHAASPPHPHRRLLLRDLGPEIARYQAATGTPGITTCTNAASTTPLLFDPGDRWDYGISIDWAGKMVEAASGQKLDRYFQDNIFGPLGMKDTGFSSRPSQQARLAACTSATPTARSPPSSSASRGAGVPHGRRRTVRHRSRLPRVHANDHATAARQRRAGAAARDRRPHGAKPHRRPRDRRDQDRHPAALQRRRALPGDLQEVGAQLPDQRPGRADRPRGRQPGVGRAGQHLLLDPTATAGSSIELPVVPAEFDCWQQPPHDPAGLLRCKILCWMSLPGSLSPSVPRDRHSACSWSPLVRSVTLVCGHEQGVFQLGRAA